MSDIHIEDFYKDAARTFLKLYAYFPKRASVYVEDIAGEEELDEFGLHTDRHLACFGTLLWLADEGFIRYDDTIRQLAIDQAVLTHKTFVLLSARCELNPPSIDESVNTPASVIADQHTNISQLRSAVKSGSSEAIKNITRYLLALAA